MDIPAKIKVPEYVYRFYRNAAQNVAGLTTEQIMADALSAYAAVLSDAVKKDRQAAITKQASRISCDHSCQD